MFLLLNAMILVILGSRLFRARVGALPAFYDVIASGNQRREVLPGTHDRLYLPAVADNNSFRDCSILDSNSWRIRASWKTPTGKPDPRVVWRNIAPYAMSEQYNGVRDKKCLFDSKLGEITIRETRNRAVVLHPAYYQCTDARIDACGLQPATLLWKSD